MDDLDYLIELVERHLLSIEERQAQDKEAIGYIRKFLGEMKQLKKPEGGS